MDELQNRNRVIQEKLDAMGATKHYIPKRVEMPSPLTMDGSLRRVVMQRKLANVSSGLIDKREAYEMLNALTTEIDDKRGEFDTLSVEYTALSLSASKNPRGYNMHGIFNEQRLEVHDVWNEMSDLREKIWQLERTRGIFLDGVTVVDEKEWLELYDELHAELLVNRNKLLSC